MINLEYKETTKEKNNFYCSDYGKLGIDLYFAFKGEPKTNPPKWHDTLKWGAGKGVEMALLDILKSNGIVAEDYEQEKHGRVEMVREGVQINGYIDAMTTGDKVKEFGLEAGCPIEIKSINNANKFDIAKYETENPRDNYVGQLASYMDFLGKDRGYLFVASIDGLHHFFFECRRVKDKIYKCGNVQVDMGQEYKRFADIYYNNIQKDIIPECPIRYKIPVKDIDWTKVSVSDIAKARKGQKVIGDKDSWVIAYSNWKDKIIEMQGVRAGYSEQEIDEILTATKGYTSKRGG